LLSLTLGLALEPRSLRVAVRRPVLRRTLPVALVAVPLLAMAIVSVFPMHRVAGGLLLLLSISPGLILLTLSQGRAPGRAPVAVAMAIVLMLAGVVTLPLGFVVLERLFPMELRVAPADLLKKVLLPVLGPLVLGVAIRRVSETGAARLHLWVDVLFKVSLACLLLLVVPAALRGLGQLGAVDIVATLLFVALSAALGHVVGGPDEADRALAATAVVLGNPALALLVATASYPNAEVLPVVAVLILLRFVVIIPYGVVLKRRGGAAGRARSSEG
jgi:BASS family bile acid:Na+ symporter